MYLKETPLFLVTSTVYRTWSNGWSIFLSLIKSRCYFKRVLFINLLIFGGALVLFSHITNLPIALFFAMLAGFGMMSQNTICNTIVPVSYTHLTLPTKRI